jgi:hypothetical protein
VRRGVFVRVCRRLDRGTSVHPVAVSDLGCGHCGIPREQVTSSKEELYVYVIDQIVILGTISNNRKQQLVTSTCNCLPSPTMLIDASLRSLLRKLIVPVASQNTLCRSDSQQIAQPDLVAVVNHVLLSSALNYL